MSLLREEDRQTLIREFEGLTRSVQLLFFSRETDCTHCGETRQVLDELSGLSERITVKEVSFEEERETAGKYRIDKVPAIVVSDENGTDTGVRFFGIPAGYEFVSLVGAVKDAGSGAVELSPAVQEQVRRIEDPVHIQVFVTPSCPYCPAAVRLAHQMALINPNITADMVEATEFPQLAQRYNVRGVPRSVVNDDYPIEGAVPEQAFLDTVLRALGKAETPMQMAEQA